MQPEGYHDVQYSKRFIGSDFLSLAQQRKKGKRKNKENKQNQKSCPTLTTSFTHEQQGI
jgi:hypothetical protein